MKKHVITTSVFLISFFTSISVVSAHGLHEEVYEVSEHIFVHLLQNTVGVFVVGGILALGSFLRKKRPSKWFSAMKD